MWYSGVWLGARRGLMTSFQKIYRFAVHRKTQKLRFQIYLLWDPVKKNISYTLPKRPIRVDETPIYGTKCICIQWNESQCWQCLSLFSFGFLIFYIGFIPSNQNKCCKKKPGFTAVPSIPYHRQGCQKWLQRRLRFKRDMDKNLVLIKLICFPHIILFSIRSTIKNNFFLDIIIDKSHWINKFFIL